MLKKRTDYTSAKHWQRVCDYVGAWRTTGVVSLLGLLVLGLRYAYLWFAATDRYNAQLRVVDSLAVQDPDGRRVVAANLLWLYEQGMAPDALQDPEFRTVVDAVQQTGSGGWTTIYPPTWGPFIHEWVPFWILCTLCVFSLMLGFVYHLECRDKRHYLADLPWSRPWVWCFALITPVLWLPFAVSGIRMLLRPPQVQPARPRGDRRRHFTPDTAGAKAIYWAMRARGTVAGHQLYRQGVETELHELQQDCADLAKELRDTQQRQLKLKAEFAQLHDAPDPEPPTDDLLEKEFERLLRLPGVSGIRPVGAEGIALMLTASVEYQAQRYDLGTWKLRLELSGLVEATELKTGVLPSWRGGAPVYRMSKKFCFGDHERLIKKHLTRGHILEAAALAVQALNTVNTIHQRSIPLAFRQIEEEDA